MAVTREEKRPGAALARRLLPFFVYLAGAGLVAGVLAYPLWVLFTAAGVELPFHKFTFRLLEAAAVIGLWPLMAHLGLNRPEAFGFGAGITSGVWRASPVGGVAAGFVTGVLVLALIVFSLLLFDVRVVRADAPANLSSFIIVLLKGMAVGLVIALIEELWFRGALQRALQQQTGTVVAIVVTALFYALTHFVRPDLRIPEAELSFFSGFLVIAGAFDRFANPEIVDSLAALTAVGVFLSLVRLRTGRIWECIGLHAGFVSVIKVSRDLTTIEAGSTHRYLVSSFDGVVGIFACGVFVLLAFVYWHYSRRSGIRPAAISD